MGHTTLKRRISYVIPPPADPSPPLLLPSHGVPRLGLIGPLLLPSQHPQPPLKWASGIHPRHRLGVACLAVDTSTHLAGRNAPEGILYTGGRDGLVISWDLAIPMKKREQALHGHVGRWETMTGWADEAIDEEEEGEGGPTDGDVLGDVLPSARRRRWAGEMGDVIPHEQEWETDVEAFKPGQRSLFRQCVQTHSDWVNDVLLCNYNQTVVSASSDGTIKAWNPHSTTPADPSLIGSHNDYVRCLTHCREQNWLASGSFDRTVKLWDLSRTAQADKSDPIMTLTPPDAPKSSVYAVAADPFGRAIASGSPERVVRMWDPRSGKRTGKLVGHTDNIRAILISDDSRYLLTGSADASVKLWSLATQRCLHTFMHHTDSVWSLFSSHPSLEIFYSGDKSGLVCKIDVEDCSDVSEGECIVLCHDAGERGVASSEGINKIVAMDNNLLWTASGSSSIKRWCVPQRRAVRAAALATDGAADHLAVPKSPVPKKRVLNNGETANSPTHSIRETATANHPPPQSPRNSMVPSLPGSLTSENGLPHRSPGDDTVLYGIPFESLVRLTSPNDPFTPLMLTSRGRDPEVATLYSAASVMSVPRTTVRSSLPASFYPASPMRSSRTEDSAHPVHTARANFEERELAADAKPLYGTPDDVIDGDNGLVRSIILNDRIHALTVDTSGEVAVWDIVRGVCRGAFTREDIASASLCGSAMDGSGCEKERSPREALETVRERIEGEAVVVPWSTADTKTGVLTVHLNEKCFEAEIYADEVGFAPDRHYTDEYRLNIGKWVLRNLFLGFIREEQRVRRKRDNDGGTPPPRTSTTHSDASSRKRSSSDMKPLAFSSSSSIVISSSTMIPAISPTVSSSTRGSPLMTQVMKLHPIMKDVSLPTIPHAPVPGPGSNSGTSMPRPLRMQTADTITPANPPPSAMPKDADYFTRQPSSSTPGLAPDDFSGWAGPANAAKPEHGAAAPLTPGGLIGRLKHFGKISTKKPAGDVGPSSPAPGAVVPETHVVVEESSPSGNPKQTPLQVLLAGPLTPPPSTEAPSHPLPPNMPIVISEEASHGWTTVYRGTVSNTYHDVRALEESMPMWLLECLLTNKVPPTPVNKLSFVLLPQPNKDPDAEQLPELLNTTQSKLTASRFLRVRKLVIHVQEKLEKMAGSPGLGGSARSSLEKPPSSRGSRPGDDVYEILCNDVLLPLDMSLAAVRQFVWRQAGELTMHYRRKVAVVDDDMGAVVDT